MKVYTYAFNEILAMLGNRVLGGYTHGCGVVCLRGCVYLWPCLVHTKLSPNSQFSITSDHIQNFLTHINS